MTNGIHKAKSFPLEKEIPGISVKTNQEHYKLYQGYVNKRNEIEEKLKTADRSKAASTYSEYGELKRQETFNVNGMIFHEIWFNTIYGGDGVPKGEIVEQIKKDFGSFEAWVEDFKATAMAARGWAWLVYDLSDHRLHNYLIDLQNIGFTAMCIPILGLDVFEHAYFIDYGTNRKNYVDNFFKVINWDYVNKRWEFAKKVGELYKASGL